MSVEDDIKRTIELYVTGFNRGDRDMILEALHPKAVSAGFVGGALQWDSAEEFAEFCAEAAPDRNGDIPPWSIETLSVSGQTAVAVVNDQWGARRFRDTLTLLQIDGRWQIAFKAFHGLG